MNSSKVFIICLSFMVELGNALTIYSLKSSKLVNIPGPLANGWLNLVLYILSIAIGLLLVMLCCFSCYFCFCRKAKEQDQLVVTPSELIAIGATPSELKAANISPSVLKDSGATYDQMAQLGATPSQLVEAGAQKQDLKRLGATQSQISHVGFGRKEKEGNVSKLMANTASQKPVSEAKDNPFSGHSNKGENKRVSIKSSKTSQMSQLTEKLAEKLMDKPKKSSFNDKGSQVSQTKGVSVAPSAVPTTAQPTAQPPLSTMSTVSTSPQKRAAALKATDDSMSVAMGPPSNS